MGQAFLPQTCPRFDPFLDPLSTTVNYLAALSKHISSAVATTAITTTTTRHAKQITHCCPIVVLPSYTDSRSSPSIYSEKSKDRPCGSDDHDDDHVHCSSVTNILFHSKQPLPLLSDIQVAEAVVIGPSSIVVFTSTHLIVAACAVMLLNTMLIMSMSVCKQFRTINLRHVLISLLSPQQQRLAESDTSS